ncbi:MAG: right-handed parallel beta-helix repeat-containing protein [Bacteroidetes bacterium]|nr:right-handed parallel beta-helix repeat-containing protein [Bacteroidota bacterium]MCB0708045.1 right-handed parallel beta-helix repeat-containing protein [Chitinophagaceae bacterium]
MKKNLVLLFLIFSCFAFLTPNKKPTIFLVGDSTMANKPVDDNPERGWGQLFPNYMNDEVEIQNHAVNGRSTKSFINEHRWDTVMSRLKAGDFVMIQFGHNDSKVNDSLRSAPAHTLYKQNLVRFVNDVRSKGATPILITPVMRRKFDSAGRFVDQHGDYPAVVKEVAASMHVMLIDLHKSSEALIVKEGVENSRRLFLNIPPHHFKNYKGKEEDNTHFSEYGASSVASLVCESIKEQNLPLAKYLKPSAFKEKYAFELPKIYKPHFKLDTFNIKNYGAIADGMTLNTTAINNAINDCARQGGGTVLIPNGSFVTGPIILKSNINLHLAKGALVIFSSHFNQYPLVESSFEGVATARCQSPVVAENLQNIAITGPGIMNGNGYYWRPLKKDKLSESQWKKHQAEYGGVLSADKKIWYPSEKALKGSLTNNIGKLTEGKTLNDFEEVKDFLRPNMIRIYQCKNILIEDVTFENAPAWTTHLVMSEHISIKNLTVKNPWYGANTDALDLESCKNALIEDCNFDTGDDGICIKSGRDAEGRKRGMPTQDIIINNCTVYRSHGGFVIGSEMSGGAKNIFVSNCTFIGSDIGLRFKTTRGRGGIVENIFVNNINMKDIAAEAILFDMYYMAKDPVVLAGEKREPPKVEFLKVDETTPQFRNFYFHDITCNGAAKGIFVRGIPEMHVKNILINHAVLQADEGIDIQEASDITLNDITMISKNTNPVNYILNSDNISINNLKYKEGAALLAQVQGGRTKDIFILNTDLSKAKQQLDCGFGATNAVVNWVRPNVAQPAKKNNPGKKN